MAPKSNGKGGGGNSHQRSMAKTPPPPPPQPPMDTVASSEAPSPGRSIWGILLVTATTGLSLVSLGWASMTYSWWPNSLVIGQTLFALTALVVLIACGWGAIVAEKPSLRARVIASLALSTFFVAFCTYAITVIQIHKHEPEGATSIKQSIFSLEGGSSIGAFNGSGNSFVVGGGSDGAMVHANKAQLGELNIQDFHGCTGGMGSWTCFLLNEKIYIAQGNAEKFEEVAKRYNPQVVNLHLMAHPELADECHREVDANIEIMRTGLRTKDDKIVDALLNEYPVCFLDERVPKK